MIYTCDTCGGMLDARQLYDTQTGNKLKFAKCSFCGNMVTLEQDRFKDNQLAYAHLANHEFPQAITYFDRGIADGVPHPAKIPAYLGRALAEDGIQAIFDDEAADTSKPPELIFHSVKFSDFAEDNRFYAKALECAGVSPEAMQEKKLFSKKHKVDSTRKSSDIERLAQYAYKINLFRSEYRSLEKSGLVHSVFIAFADKTKEALEMYEIANTIRNQLDRELAKSVFMLRPYDSFTDEDERTRYEARILYAIHHSECMIILVPENIDTRLNSIYSRYFSAHQSNYKKPILNRMHFFNLGKDVRSIWLPNGSSLEILPFTGNEQTRMIYDAVNFTHINNGVRVISNMGDPKVDILTTPDDKNQPRSITQTYGFGMFPQKLVSLPELEKQLKKQYPFENPEGWTPIWKDPSGTKDVAWYKDVMYGENGEWAKYRVVFYTKDRGKRCLGNYEPSAIQINAHYTPYKYYIFKFDPIEWYEIERNEETREKTLLSSISLEPRPFNCEEMNGKWNESTLRRWLNEQFLEIAFTEEQRKELIRDGSEYVFLIDHVQDLENLYMKKNISRLKFFPSDYFKCMGGAYESNTCEALWIQTSEKQSPGSVQVALPNGGNGTRTSDATTVAVVPKIIVELHDD